MGSESLGSHHVKQWGAHHDPYAGACSIARASVGGSGDAIPGPNVVFNLLECREHTDYWGERETYSLKGERSNGMCNPVITGFSIVAAEKAVLFLYADNIIEESLY